MVKNLLTYIISGEKRILIIYAIVMLGLGIIGFSESGKSANRALEEQMLHRETILVRAGAQMIQQYFTEREKSLVLFASRDVIKSNNQGTLIENTLKKEMHILGGPITDIIRTDKEGNVTTRASGLKEANNVSDRSYFIWSKNQENQGKVYYETKIIPRGGAEKGKEVVTMITPVWKGNENTGVLAFVLSLDKLGDSFVRNLKLSDLTNSFLLDGKGNILSAIIPGSFGENVFDYIKINNWQGKADFLIAMQAAVRGDDGKAISRFKNPDGKLVKYYFAFAPVKLFGGKYTWSLATSVPEKEVLVFSRTLYGNHNLILVYFILTVIGLVMIGLSLIKKK